MGFSPEARVRVSAAVAESNRRRGEQNPVIRAAKRLFTQHHSNATTRGVPFRLTFTEWWGVWQASGRWPERGRLAGQYCMSRYGDLGAYEIGNVFVNLVTANVGDAHRGKSKSGAQRARMSVTCLERRERDAMGRFVPYWEAELEE